MANSADPINHDGISTVATVGSKALKYGAIGAIGSFLVPALLITGLGAAIGATAGAVGIGALIGLGVGAIVGGISSFFVGGYAGIGGGLLGALKGSDQVSRENSSFRQRITERMQGRENKITKSYNDGEIKGIDEGYQLAMKDMEPQVQQREQAAFQKGQEFVVQEIQKQMMQAAEAEQQQQHAAAEHGHKHADKFVAHASCECKADAIIKERQEKAANPHQHATPS